MNVTQRQIMLEAIDKLAAMTEHDDAEIAHSEAEDILCGLLKELGFGDAAEAFERASERVGFWYA